ncbi:hypothetical protein DSO57_1021506 [Entomophthora muscae]|uniref:Uncharacterized protein n=1 Tax=Entomophthora muscae TaxID=34485 RepID=A0ACC2S5K1_9FUNG|nr:hypothetical protein DSO57_1021506 [Entomophthora muscae]
MSFERLPTEILSQIVQHIEIGKLGPISQANRRFRLLCRERLIRVLPRLAIRLTARQGDCQSKHLCAEFHFQQLSFGTTRVKLQVHRSFDAEFESEPLSPHPIVRYLRISDGCSTSNIALSRPITLPVRNITQHTALGHRGEISLSYCVEERNGQHWMRVTGMEMDLKMFALPSVKEKLVQSFPPASLFDWLRFQLFDPSAQAKENARFRDAVPWAPFITWKTGGVVSHYSRPARVTGILYLIKSSITFDVSAFSIRNLAQTFVSLLRSLKTTM